MTRHLQHVRPGDAIIVIGRDWTRQARRITSAGPAKLTDSAGAAWNRHGRRWGAGNSTREIARPAHPAA